MKRSNLLIPLLALCAWSCTKDLTDLPEKNEAPLTTRAAANDPIAALVDKPIYIKTYNSNSGVKTLFLSLLYETSEDVDIKSKVAYFPALTVESFDNTADPYLQKRQMWYIRSNGNGLYRLESAVSDLVIKTDVHGFFGETKYWNYWTACYGGAPIGHWGDKGALYTEMKPMEMMTSECNFTFKKVGADSLSLYQIITNTTKPQFDNYVLYYESPNLGGSQLKMYNTNHGESTFEITYAEETIFDHIDYDLTQAEINFAPTEIKEEIISNPSQLQPLEKAYEWVRKERKNQNWTEDKATTHQFGMDLSMNIIGKTMVGTPNTSSDSNGNINISYDYTTSKKVEYGVVNESDVTETERMSFSIDPGKTVKIVREMSDCVASVPYTVYLKGKSTGQIYQFKGVWQGVDITRNSLLTYDITDSKNPVCLSNISTLPSGGADVYDAKINLSLQEQGDGLYRLYYKFVNPNYPNPKFIMRIHRYFGESSDWMLHAPMGQRKDENGRTYFLFSYPEGGTSYDLFVTAISGNKDTVAKMHIEESH